MKYETLTKRKINIYFILCFFMSTNQYFNVHKHIKITKTNCAQKRSQDQGKVIKRESEISMT